MCEGEMWCAGKKKKYGFVPADRCGLQRIKISTTFRIGIWNTSCGLPDRKRTDFLAVAVYNIGTGRASFARAARYTGLMQMMTVPFDVCF